MNYEGQDLKFRITAQISGFSLATDAFMIIVKNGYGRVVRRIPRTECFFDSDLRPYFTMEAVPAGIYYATFVGGIPDDDYTKQQQAVTDRQWLVTVGSVAVPQQPAVQHKVQYEQVYVVSVDDADYLADAAGNYIKYSFH